MNRSSKKARQARKKGTKGAKMVISAAAIAVTFGGWAAMAANDEWAATVQAQTRSQAQALVSTQTHQDTRRLADAQPPVPFLMTHSSR